MLGGKKTLIGFRIKFANFHLNSNATLVNHGFPRLILPAKIPRFALQNWFWEPHGKVKFPHDFPNPSKVQGYPQRMTLQRRLYEILFYTHGFLQPWQNRKKMPPQKPSLQIIE